VVEWIVGWVCQAKVLAGAEVVREKAEEEWQLPDFTVRWNYLPGIQ
jgi:hypothetical protein